MPVCPISSYCLSNTGIPFLDNLYVIQPGTYNSYSYFIGETNGWYLYFSSLGYWCLSENIGDPCIMSGRIPCISDCPDLCTEYFNEGGCPEPTPPPVNPCVS